MMADGFWPYRLAREITEGHSDQSPTYTCPQDSNPARTKRQSFRLSTNNRLVRRTFFMMASVAASATVPAEVDAEKAAEATVSVDVGSERLVGSLASSDSSREKREERMKPEFKPEAKPSAKPPPYSALSPGRRRFILYVVTAAGFFGPLAANIYLPALPTLQKVFHTFATTINATVSVFKGVLAVAVGTP